MISYDAQRGLLIEIPTSCPAAVHEQMMRGITTAVRLGMMSPDKRDCDMDNMTFLMDLLDELLPDERQLECKQ